MMQDRQQFTDEFPDEFGDKLKEYIDEIESRVNAARDCLAVECLSDLSKIEDAKFILDDLSKKLY